MDCGVIFDMDGVLVDTAPQHFESWQRAAARWNAQISYEDFRQTFGRPNHQIIPILFRRSVGQQELREIDQFKEAAFREILGRCIEPLPGVMRLIRELHDRGFRLAVGSSGPRENIELVLKGLGVADCFGAVVSGWDVQRGKPDPEVFLKAASAIGVEPARCLVIEDVPAGLEAAHAAGMKCLAVTTTRPAMELQAADWLVESLEPVRVEDVVRLIGAE